MIISIVAIFHIPIDVQLRFEYDLRYDANRITAIGARIKRRAHWGDCGAALRTDFVAIHLDMAFIRCTKELPYMSRLVGFMDCYADLWNEELTTHSLNYITLLRPFD